MITEKQKTALVALRDAIALCQKTQIGIGPTHACKIRVFIHSGPDVLSNAHNLDARDIDRLLAENPVATGPWINKNCYCCGGSGIEEPEHGVTRGGRRCTACSSADARGLPK